MSLCSLAATGPWRRFYDILLKLNLCWDAIYIYTLMIYWWYGNSVFGKDSNLILRNEAQLVCCWFPVFSIFSFASIGQSELARDINRSLHEPINRGGECFFLQLLLQLVKDYWAISSACSLHWVYNGIYIYIMILYNIYLMYIACKCKQSHVHFVEMYTFTWTLGHLIINYRVLHRIAILNAAQRWWQLVSSSRHVYVTAAQLFQGNDLRWF